MLRFEFSLQVPVFIPIQVIWLHCDISSLMGHVETFFSLGLIFPICKQADSKLY